MDFTTKILSEILDFYKYKIDNNLCTMDEINSAVKVLENEMTVHGTIQDFANFYNVPEPTIRANIFRKLVAKPKRVLLYPFHKFRKIVPEKWRDKK